MSLSAFQLPPQFFLPFRAKCTPKWCRLSLNFLTHPSIKPQQSAFHSPSQHASLHWNVSRGRFPEPRLHFPLWHMVRATLSYWNFASKILSYSTGLTPPIPGKAPVFLSGPQNPAHLAKQLMPFPLPEMLFPTFNPSSRATSPWSLLWQLRPPVFVLSLNFCVSRFSPYLMACFSSASHCFNWQKRHTF